MPQIDCQTKTSYTRQTRDVGPKLGEYWASVEDDGPTFIQHWANISCLLEQYMIADQLSFCRDNQTIPQNHVDSVDHNFIFKNEDRLNTFADIMYSWIEALRV